MIVAAIVMYADPGWFFNGIGWLLGFPFLFFHWVVVSYGLDEALLDSPATLLANSLCWVMVVYPGWLLYNRLCRPKAAHPFHREGATGNLRLGP
jgi:hypothetical protein